MSTTAELPIEPGLAVEIDRIDKELGQLWESNDDTKTRASLINLAIYTEDSGGVAENTELIAHIASEHACRAILILANPSAPKPAAKAWISAHCHLAGKGERQICSEQITFQLDGDMVGALPSIVFSHLDSDLPLCFWWQGEFNEPLDEELWTWVDRLIFDSACWKNPAEQLALVEKIGTLTNARTVLCDLNWTRLFGTRIALAQVFDHSCALSHLSTIRRVEITSNKRSTGLLLLGWLSAQLGWKFQPLLGKEFFTAPDGSHIEFTVTEVQGADISRCAFDCEDAKFEITRAANSDYFHSSINAEGVCKTPTLISAGKSGPADILLVELSRGGKHPLYSKALAAIAPLLQN